MRKVLIVNLTRFGDLLQTSPTVVGLRALHPAAEITVLVERNFADVARGLPAVDRVWELDLDHLGRLLLQDTGNGLREAYAAVAETVAALRAEGFDLALNYSSSRMSAVLLGMIGAPDTRGWTMTADGHRLIAHRWSRLFAASCLTRRQAPFNLVDYYQRVAGVASGPRRLFFTVPAAAEARAAEVLGAAGVRSSDPVIAFQLGASRAIRRWPAASFVALGRELHARLGARLLLCGGAGDRGMAEEIAAALGDAVIDVCGRTSIAELGALLARADVLVTGDTGPMHMAVAVGTPVVALFFGPALPADTGPYAADHVCLHADVPCAPCDHNVTCLEPFCRDTLDPAAVADAVVARRMGDWPALDAAAARWPGIAWYRTGFDAEGLADLVPLGGRPPTRQEGLRRAGRALWKAVLEGTTSRVRGPSLGADAAIVRQVVRLADEAVARARAVEALALDPSDLDALEAAARRLEEADAALVRLGAMHEPAALLLQVHRFEKENIDGDGVAGLARATRQLHEALAARARLFVELLEPPAATLPARRGEGSMRVALDGNEIEVPGASTLGELLDGLAPRIDPARLVTRIDVDGATADPTDRRALAAWRLTGNETLAIVSETPAEFARVRRAEIADHLTRIADRLSTAASGLLAGDTAGANRLLATATRDLALVLQLDQHVALLDAGEARCHGVARAVDRVGPLLTDAERGRRWPEVARLLQDELVPALRTEVR